MHEKEAGLEGEGLPPCGCQQKPGFSLSLPGAPENDLHPGTLENILPQAVETEHYASALDRPGVESPQVDWERCGGRSCIRHEAAL